MNNVRRKSVSVLNCRMVSTIQRRVTTPCPCGAAVDTNRSTRLRHRPRVSCDPSGWDRGVCCSHAAGPTRCRRSWEVRLLPAASEVIHPVPPQTSKRGGYGIADLCGILFSWLTAGRAVIVLGGAKLSENTKKEHEKSSKPFALSLEYKQSSILARRPKSSSSECW